MRSPLEQAAIAYALAFDAFERVANRSDDESSLHTKNLLARRFLLTERELVRLGLEAAKQSNDQ